MLMDAWQSPSFKPLPRPIVPVTVGIGGAADCISLRGSPAYVASSWKLRESGEVTTAANTVWIGQWRNFTSHGSFHAQRSRRVSIRSGWRSVRARSRNGVCEDAGTSSQLASSFSSLAQRHSDSVGDDGELAADNACAEVAQTASNRGGRRSASG